MNVKRHPRIKQKVGAHIGVCKPFCPNDGTVTGFSTSIALTYIPRHFVCLSTFTMPKALCLTSSLYPTAVCFLPRGPSAGLVLPAIVAEQSAFRSEPRSKLQAGPLSVSFTEFLFATFE